jgi:hypothetical protein
MFSFDLVDLSKAQSSIESHFCNTSSSLALAQTFFSFTDCSDRVDFFVGVGDHE